MRKKIIENFSPTKITHQDMKNKNKRIILEFIKKNNISSRKEIREKTGMSLGTVSKLVDELIREKMIKEDLVIEKQEFFEKTKLRPAGSGRRIIPLRINPDYEFSVGCEINEEKIISILIDGCRNKRNFLVVEKDRIEGKNLEEKIENCIRTLLKKFSFPERIKGIGFCLPGSVNYRDGIVVHSPRLNNLSNYPLKQIMEEKFGLPVIVENRARAQGFAEYMFGRGRNFKNIIYIHIGRGIGSAIIIKGEIYRGSNDMGGEVGHMSIDRNENAPRCICGNKGCLEAFASTFAMVKRAKILIEKGIKTSLNSETLSFDQLINGATSGDKISLIVFEETLNYLAQGLGNILNLFDPELLILGGEITKIRKFFIPLESMIKTRAITEIADNFIIDFGILGDEAGSVGVAELVFEGINLSHKGVKL